VNKDGFSSVGQTRAGGFAHPALRSLRNWHYLPALRAPAPHGEDGEVRWLRARLRATAVEAPAELLVERLPAARCLACSRRPLRRLHSAGHQEEPLSGCSWAP
jgi:hypothetical protein